MAEKHRKRRCPCRLWISGIMFCVLQTCFSDEVGAQRYSWEEFVEKFSVDEYDDGREDLNLLFERLEELHEHPFNLNAATKEDLEQLPFLNGNDIEEILAYIYLHGSMQSLGELMLIEELGWQTRQFLTLFVYVDDPVEEKGRPSLKTLLKEGKHEVSTRLDVPLYEREGYKIPGYEALLENPNKVYLGNSLYHNIRYTYKYRNKLFWGFTAEKDAGEPFGSYGNKAYDAYSFHFLLKDCGMLKILALGDYRLGFGEGLVVNSDFSFGKSVSFNMGDTKLAVRRFSSISENSFFRGAAATLRVGNTDVSAFYSFLPLDATLREDGTISSLKADGLHRTLSELSKKHNVTEQSAGTDVTWNGKHFDLGATVFYQHYDKPFSEGTELYRHYYPEGKDFLNVGAHYRWHDGNFSFSGETAFSNVHGGWATLNKGIWRFNHKYSVVALQRLYAYRYVGLRANSFSEGGAVRNESGFYAGVEAAPLNELKMSAYVDYFYFPWTKFGIPHTSDGVEGTFQAEWASYRKWNISGRYQLKRKERNKLPYLYHKLKMQVQYVPLKTLEWRGMARFTRVRDIYGRHVKGYMGGSILKLKDRKDRLNTALSCFYFDSEDYKAPMSFYEPSLLYAFSFMTMYGQGMRASLNARWNVARHWMLMLKYGVTGYFDRKEIGEGLQRIGGRWKEDLSFLLRCSF